jgi:hypothetical protein
MGGVPSRAIGIILIYAIHACRSRVKNDSEKGKLTRPGKLAPSLLKTRFACDEDAAAGEPVVPT